MIYRDMLNNNNHISAIGYGACINNTDNIKEDYKRIERLIKQNVDLKSNIIDTAPVYGMGESEVIIGRAIKDIRSNVIVATKVSPGDTSFNGVISSLESSLKRMQTEYVDILQVHWPNPKIPLVETVAAIEKLIDDGKVRYIGVSNFTFREIKNTIAELKNNSLASIQVEYNLFERSIEKELLPFAQKNNILVLAYSPFAQGKLANGEKQIDLINDLAVKYNAKPGQIVLKFLISNSQVVAIPNTTNLNRLIENINSMDLNIDKDDLLLIDKICRTSVELIDTRKIRVSGEYNRRVYSNLDQAKENKMNMTPSPNELADEIRNGDFLKPVRLKTPSCKNEGKNFDLIEGRLRYWAWVIAFGWNKPIPALVWQN